MLAKADRLHGKCLLSDQLERLPTSTQGDVGSIPVKLKQIRSSITRDKISGQHFVALPRSVVTRRRGDGLAAPLFVARRHPDRVSSRGAASHHRQGRRRHQLRSRAVALLHLSHVQVMTLF